MVSLEDVHKSYGQLKVVNGLNLEVYSGDVVGFLGRNGAGKSTAIKLIMGLTQSDRGLIGLFGKPLNKQSISVRQRIGYVAQEQHMYPWMTPQVISSFVKGFYPRWDGARFNSLSSNFELPLNRRIGTFSGGMKAKLALSLALAIQPDLLILDEPTAGMDPIARREFLGLVREQTSKDGSTVFFSTHLIDEVEALADKVAIVEAGKCIYSDTLEELSISFEAWSISEDQLVPDDSVGSSLCRVVSEQVLRSRLVRVYHVDQSDSDYGSRLTHQGWVREPLSLEDIFVALVNSSK